MSLEAKLEALTAAVVNLTAIMQGASITPNAPAAPVIPPAAPPAAVPGFRDPVQELSGAVAPTAPAAVPMAAREASGTPAAPAMPPPPSFIPEPVAPAAPVLPFHDVPTLARWATQQYQELGPERGARIQDVMTSIGASDMGSITPDKFAAFHAGVVALRG